MRKSLLVAATAAATAMLVMSPMAAAAAAPHDVLTTGKVGGANVAVHAVLKAGLKAGTTATFVKPGTTRGVRCKTSAVTAKVTANPPRPGTAVVSVTVDTFAECAPSIAGVSRVLSLTSRDLPYRTTVSDARGFPVTVFKPSTMIRLMTVAGPITCMYSAAKISGHASNTGQTVSFSNQVLAKSGGSGLCLARVAFSATYGPVIDNSMMGHPHVFVN
jgi:hypothetical protein